MKEFWNIIQVIFAAIGGWLGYFLGGCDGLLYALLAFVALDYITGLMCAIVDKKLSSVDRTCNERMELMIRQMSEQQGVTEALKASDQMAWVGAMSNLRNRAEEIVLSEVVYA